MVKPVLNSERYNGIRMTHENVLKMTIPEYSCHLSRKLKVTSSKVEC
jgi:hypothetical protein